MDRDTYEIEVAGVKRDLPLMEVAPGLVVPVFNMLGDVAVVEATATALAPRVPEQVQILVTTEAKSIPLTHALAAQTRLPYVVLRRTYQPYMGAVIEVETLAITTGKRRTLYLEEKDRARCVGKRVALVEDVVTTGSNAQGMRNVMKRVSADVVAEIAVFTEGSPDRWPDVISLGHLPLMTRTQG